MAGPHRTKNGPFLPGLANRPPPRAKVRLSRAWWYLDRPTKRARQIAEPWRGIRVTVFRAHFRLGSWYHFTPLRRFGTKGTSGKGCTGDGAFSPW